MLRHSIVFLWIALFGCAYAKSIAATQPNIVMILSDDAGYNEFGFANAVSGHPTTNAVTPNLDALAAESVVMRQGYVASSICTLSRAGLLLGQYQQRAGMEENLGNDITSPFGLPAGGPTIATHLKALGYTTQAIGKWHLGSLAGVNRPRDVGFDEFYGSLGGARSYFAGDANPDIQMRHADASGDVVIESSWASAQNNFYVTDYFGERATSYIGGHANTANPFFMYVAFTAPHTPWAGGPNGNGTLNIDYNDPQIATITDPFDRTTAALIHGMDRSVGNIVKALKDPNNDGNMSDSVYDNTIIVFMNDNGGIFMNEPGNPHTQNQPFSGFKGQALEGGIRVPFFMKAPGLDAGVYDRPISAFDMLPTLVTAAGGTAPTGDVPGVDIMPYLEGDVAGDPHETMFWRNRSWWAMRSGDYKYGRPYEPNFAWPYLWDLSTTTAEGGANNVLGAHPEIGAEMQRTFTDWEATLAKPQYGNLGADDRNKFDHFVFRNNAAASTTWSTASAWFEAGTTNQKTMKVDDAYANAILEFTTRDDANYTATNDMARMSGLTFMLNQLRFTGNFMGAAQRTATINGGPLSFAVNGANSITSASNLLLVKSLTGQLPRLQLDATSTNTPANFRFQVAHNLELHDDLQITGNGTQEFVFTGTIRDFFAPRNVLKSGTSRITVQGASTFKGSLSISGGEVRFNGAGASLNGPTAVTIGAAGALRLDQGTITVPTLDNSAGGQFAFNGGRLAVVNVLGNLTNSGGTYAPGASPAASSISGNFTQASGKLEIELGGVMAGTQFDRVAVGGTATLGGTLEVKLINGFSPTFGQKFEFLDSAATAGTFTSYSLPTLSGGWSLQNNGHSLSLMVGLPGDYNGDNVVNATDYTVWRNSRGQTVAAGVGADGNRDTQITMADYVIWKNNFGAFRIFSSGAGAGAGASVPEPTTIGFVMLAAATVMAACRRRRRR